MGCSKLRRTWFIKETIRDSRYCRTRKPMIDIIDILIDMGYDKDAATFITKRIYTTHTALTQEYLEDLLGRYY